MPSRNTVKTETLVEEVNVAEVEYSTVIRVELPFALTVPRTVAVSASTLVAESSETVGVPTGEMIEGKSEAPTLAAPLFTHVNAPQHQTFSSWSMAQVVPGPAFMVVNCVPAGTRGVRYVLPPSVVPVPSWPEPLLPKHPVLSEMVRTHV